MDGRMPSSGYQVLTVTCDRALAIEGINLGEMCCPAFEEPALHDPAFGTMIVFYWQADHSLLAVWR